MTMQNTVSPAAPAPVPRQPPRRRWLRPTLLLLSALLVVIVALIWGALRTEAGARTLWRLATGVLPGTLSGQFVGGTLANGLDLRDLRYRDAQRVVQIDRVKATWQLSVLPPALVIGSLHMGKADVRLLPTPPTPLVLPSSITTPLAMNLWDLRVGQLVLHQGAATSQYSDIRLSAKTDRFHHQIDLTNAVTPYGTAHASLNLLGGSAPFAVTGNASLVTRYDNQSYTADLNVAGSLKNLSVTLRAAGGKLVGRAEIDATPFNPVPFVRARVMVDHVDPKYYNPSAPRADLRIRATLAPGVPTTATPAAKTDLSSLTVSGPITITNAIPGAIDQGLLPLVSAQAEVLLTAQHQQLRQILLKLPGNASLGGAAELAATGRGKLKLQATQLDLHALHGALKPTRLDGPLTLALAKGTQDINLALASPALSIRAEARVDAQQVTLRDARLQAGDSQLRLKGTLSRGEQSDYVLEGGMKDFDPTAVLSQIQASKMVTGKKLATPSLQAVAARINMDFKATGTIAPELRTDVAFQIHDSSYNNLPMTGSGKLQLRGQRLLSSDAKIAVAGNNIALKGGFGTPADRLDFKIAAPALERLGFGLAGLLEADGRLAGTLSHPVIDARYQARGLIVGAHQLARLAGEVHLNGIPGTDPNASLALKVDAQGVRSGLVDLDKLHANISGTYASHTIDLTSTGRLSGQVLALTLAAQGALKQQTQGYAWNGVVGTLQNRGIPRLSISNPLTLDVMPGKIVLGSTHLTIGPAEIDLQSLQYQPGQIRSRGAFSALQVADLLALQKKFTGASVPLKTSLVLDGSWDVDLTDSARGFVQVARRSGDVTVSTPYGENAIGLSSMTLRADLQGQRVKLSAGLDASRIGTVAANSNIALLRVDNLLTVGADSALTATVVATLPRLRTLGALTGPQISLDGSVSMNLAATGTLGKPLVSGNLNGDNLALTLYDQGVRLLDGTARIVLDNNFVDMRQVMFKGGDGTLRVTGRIPLDQTDTGLSAQITADKLRLLADPARQLTLSGQARIANIGQRLDVTGKFTVNQALFSVPDRAAPALGDDVAIIIPGAKPKAVLAGPQIPVPIPANGIASLLPPKVDIKLDLGTNFRFKGTGADIFLAGALDLRSEPGQPPQAFGNVRVVSGVYEAFGTKLAIERGIIAFQGGFDNPSINILAMRRNQSIPAGVQITGNAQQPRVELVSEPNLAEEEKLSWLVFGHGGSGTSGQAQGAAQGAALGLLNKFGGARVANSVGLDQISFGASENGSSNAQVLNLGKEISNRLFIGYEQGLAGAGSVVKLTYTLTQHWSLVARGGAITGLDVLYSRRYDRLRGDPPQPVAK